MNKICVIGLGYIGLPTAALLADCGHSVVGVDTNAAAVAKINCGQIHINEPYLEEKVAAAVLAGKLRAVAVPEAADVFIIAVPTPCTADKKADLSFVERAAESLLPHLCKGNLVILESTVPPRTTVDMLVPILKRSGLSLGADLLVAFCPERVLPGKILAELISNSRVIGGVDETSAVAAKEFYTSFVTGEIYLTDATTAEMTKLMENTYRDVNIALANEFAMIAEHVGVNSWDAIRFANHHPRVNIHQPGPGVGGHCIAVDPWFIVEQAAGKAQLIHTARNINDSMPHHVVATICELTAVVAVPKVALLGMTYKANVDDCRESPAVEIAEHLRRIGIQVVAYDPLAKHCSTVSLADALYQADLLVLLVNHDDFRFINPQKIAPLVRCKIILDTRNALERSAWESAGFEVIKLGEGRMPAAGILQRVTINR